MCKAKLKRGLGLDNNKIDLVGNVCDCWIRSVLPLQKAWLDHVDDLCNNFRFDIVQVEMVWMVSQILALPYNSIKIFVHHELGFVRRELELNQVKNDNYVNACRMFVDDAEIGLLNKYDAVITLSSVDKIKLMAHGVNVPIYSSFATVDSRPNFKLGFGCGKQLSFVGPSSHSPNYIGVTWFLENCWKKLKDHSADYKLYIYGKWDEKYVKHISSKFSDVVFCGFVEDLETAIKGSIMIVPLTIGSGIRMKILEACSIGVPFVSTSVGAEGIPVISGKHCYIADSPKDFVESLIRLQQSDLQKSFILQARKLVEENYSLEVLKNNRMDIYRNVLSQKGA